jgi:hypothetical protein
MSQMGGAASVEFRPAGIPGVARPRRSEPRGDCLLELSPGWDAGRSRRPVRALGTVGGVSLIDGRAKRGGVPVVSGRVRPTGVLFTRRSASQVDRDRPDANPAAATRRPAGAARAHAR